MQTLSQTQGVRPRRGEELNEFSQVKVMMERNPEFMKKILVTYCRNFGDTLSRI